MTFRFNGHLLGDADGYMDKEQKKAAKAADPVSRFRQRLIKDGVATEQQLAQIEADAEREILEAIEYALGSAWPDNDELRKDVYADEVPA
jgi:pyruvate dehydrogenase E1 component alpha subunit